MNNIISLSNLNLYKNQKIKVAILGGSFDPAHIGHIHIAKSALNKCGFDEVWFSLSEKNPLKPPYKYSLEERVSKLQNIIDDNRFKILIIESEMKTNFTADLFSYLSINLPIIDFSFIGGADLLLQFDKWEKFEELISMTDIVIFSRSGYSEKALEELSKKSQEYGKKVKFIEIDEINISSTEIRKQEKLDDKKH